MQEERLQAIIDYLRKNGGEKGVDLKRKEILKIAGISEGDSAKKLIKMINETDKIKVIKKGKKKIYYLVDNKNSDNKENIKSNISVNEEPKVVFNNVVQIGEDEFLTHITGQELVDLWVSKKVIYNPEIQRGTKLKINKNEAVEVPVYSIANVKKIRDKILKGQYYPDMITFNILKDGNEQLEFSDEKLIIYQGTICVSDGQHRIRALDMIRMTNNAKKTAYDLSQIKFPLKITHYDVEDAQQQFYQFSLGLKISRSRSEYFNRTNYANMVVRNLMKNSDLANRVEIVKNTISKKDTKNIVTFATLVNAIDEVYKIETKKQAEELAKYLGEYFDILINEIEELHNYEKRIKSRETSLIGENFMFYGYISISKILKDIENWQEKVKLIKELDFYKGSEIWFGKVTKYKGKDKEKGFGIINNRQSRLYMLDKAAEEFEKILAANK